MIAPFGNVKFKSYLMAEVITDCLIMFEDVGKIITYIIVNDWEMKLMRGKYGFTVPPVGFKWYLYIISFLLYSFRMNQNLKKWLYYHHDL